MTLDVINQEVPDSQQFLTSDGEKYVIGFCEELWSVGESELGKARKKRERLIKAYNCQHEDVILKRNGSKAYLPWVYTSVESWLARMSNSLVPNDEDMFALAGETPDDQAGCDMASEYLKAKFKEIGFQQVFESALKELAFGDCTVRVGWLKEEKSFTVGIDQFTGMPLKGKEVIYQGVYYEPINYKDFIIYPLTGDISRTSCAHRVWRHVDELMAAQENGVYVNVDRIAQDKADKQNEGIENKSGDVSHHQGLEVKEYWIHRIKVEGQVYHNMVATIVEGKYLIRFEPNPYDYGLRPFIYSALIQDINQNTGHGITDKAYEIQKIANFVMNQVLDESKVKLYGAYKYVDDGVFNPGGFVSRPGGLVKVADLNNIAPLNPNIGQVSFGMQELEYLEHQFEVTTGVPKFLKGMQDDNPNDTATAKRLAAEGADTRFRAQARRINETLLKPMVMMAYVLTRQYAMSDPEVLKDIARITQKSRVEVQDPMTGQVTMQEIPDEMLAQALPAIPPLSKVDVNIVGFENVLDKADKANQLERFISSAMGMASADPTALDFVKTEEAVPNLARYMGVDKENVRTKEEVAQIQMVRQQQESEMMQMEQEQALNDALMRNGGQQNVD